MALPLSNTLESGQVSGTVITPANSAVGGDAFDAINQTGTSSVKFDDTSLSRGLLAYKLLTDGSGSNGFVQWTTSLATPSEIWGRVYWMFPAYPSGGARNIAFYSSGAYTASIMLLNTGIIRIDDSVFTSADTTKPLLPGTWYRVEFHILCSATVGVIDVRIYEGDSFTLYTSVARTTANTRTSFSEIDFGVAGGGSPTNFTLYHDDIQINGVDFPGPSRIPGQADGSISAGRILSMAGQGR